MHDPSAFLFILILLLQEFNTFNIFRNVFHRLFWVYLDFLPFSLIYVVKYKKFYYNE